MTVANALWGQQGYPFLATFLDALAENYGAGMNLVDFSTDPGAARSAINTWVAGQTNGKIQNLVPPRLIDRSTRLVLTDAIYFDAAWARPFPKDQTCSGEFTLLDGQKVGAEMMVQSGRFRYAEGGDYQVIELPYLGNEVAMVLAVPKQGKFRQLEGALTAKRAEAILQQLEPRTVNLTMPKFRYESEFALRKALAGMGMPVAFETAADFSGMDGKRDLYIGDVVHKALVRVDEEGTEAAAATAVVMELGAAPSASPVTLTVDRPFVFMIRDAGTGAVLFMGRVLDPRSGPGATTKLD
jgi:serpin B